MYVFDDRFVKFLHFLSKQPKGRSPSESCRAFFNHKMLAIDTEGKDKKWVLTYVKQALQNEDQKFYGKLTDDHKLPPEVIPALNVFLSLLYNAYKKIEMNHDAEQDPSSHTTKKDTTLLKKPPKQLECITSKGTSGVGKLRVLVEGLIEIIINIHLKIKFTELNRLNNRLNKNYYFTLSKC